jgi:hypothetical protein
LVSGIIIGFSIDESPGFSTYSVAFGHEILLTILKYHLWTIRLISSFLFGLHGLLEGKIEVAEDSIFGFFLKLTFQNLTKVLISG